MKKKITVLIILAISAILSSRWTKLGYADIGLSKKLSGRILLQVQDKGEAWYVFPGDNKRYYLGKPTDAFNMMRDLALGISNKDLNLIPIAKFDYDLIDSDNDKLPDAIEESVGTDKYKKDTDNDSFEDGQEIYNGFDPLSAGGIRTLNIQGQKQAGQILMQVENRGQAWYVSPVNNMRYYLGKPNDALKIMKKLGLGVNNENLAKIDKVFVKPEFLDENIVKNETKPVDNGRLYQNPNANFTFIYPNDWKIKKFETAPDSIYLTNAERDFIAEEKALIVLNKIHFDNEYSLNNFKIAISDDKIQKLEEKNIEIETKKALELTYNYPLTYQKSITIELDNKNYINILFFGEKDSYKDFLAVFDTLIKSLKLTN